MRRFLTCFFIHSRCFRTRTSENIHLTSPEGFTGQTGTSLMKLKWILCCQVWILRVCFQPMFPS